MEKELIFTWLQQTFPWFDENMVARHSFVDGNKYCQVDFKSVPAGMKIERRCKKNKHAATLTVWIDEEKHEYANNVSCKTCMSRSFKDIRKRPEHEEDSDTPKKKKKPSLPSDYEFACLLCDGLDDICWFVPAANAWYAFNGKKWVYDKTGSFIRGKINEILIPKYEKENVIKCLETAARRDQIVKECRSLLEKTDFLSILDCNPLLVGFENGLYDFENCEFRPAKSTDYVSLSTGCNFVDINDPKHVPIQTELFNFLDDVYLGDTLKFDMMARILGSAYNGTKRKQLFFIWEGSKTPPSSELY